MLLLSDNKRPRKPGLLTTRRGTLAVAALAAGLAGVMLLVFVNNYRDSVAGEGQPARVLVANALIEKGSAGDVLAGEGVFRTASVRADQVKDGAVTDPALLRGSVARRDVLPGQQLMATDFVPARGAATSRLAGSQRAMSVPGDAVKGAKGTASTGDRVDVYASFEADGSGKAVVRQLLRDVLVLRAAEAGQRDGEFVLRVPVKAVPHVAYAADRGGLWLALRPGTGARETTAPTVTLESVLAADARELERGVGR